MLAWTGRSKVDGSIQNVSLLYAFSGEESSYESGCSRSDRRGYCFRKSITEDDAVYDKGAISEGKLKQAITSCANYLFSKRENKEKLVLEISCLEENENYQIRSNKIYKADKNDLITNIKYQDKNKLLCMYTDKITEIKTEEQAAIKKFSRILIHPNYTGIRT